jgi:WD40 repeat protein
VHADTAELRKGPVREVRNAHTKDITCLGYSKILDLVVTGSRDSSVRVWDFETMKLENILHAHKAEINILKFLDPYPLLVSGDNSGTLAIWGLM